MEYRTRIANPQEAQPKWLLIDASGQVVGRLASKIATYLQGKHKPCYTSHINCGDKVIVINAAKVCFTGKKMSQKSYISHTGYPGGQKSITPAQLHAQGRPQEILRRAIMRMLPKNKLRKEYFGNLMLYTSDQHPHIAQKPQTLTLSNNR